MKNKTHRRLPPARIINARFQKAPAPPSIRRVKIENAVAYDICHEMEAFLTEQTPSAKYRLLNECHAMLLREIHGWPESERAKVIRETESQILFHARRLVELAHTANEKSRAHKIKRTVTAALATGHGPGRAKWN
jgi:hypothetical protein